MRRPFIQQQRRCRERAEPQQLAEPAVQELHEVQVSTLALPTQRQN